MTTRYAPQARRDVTKILDYLTKRNPSGADKVALAIEHAVMVCAANPGAASSTGVATLYRRALQKYRYTIFFRTLIDSQDIEVVRIVHSSRVKNLRKLPTKD